MKKAYMIGETLQHAYELNRALDVTVETRNAEIGENARLQIQNRLLPLGLLYMSPIT